MKIPIEISARHVHLSEGHFKILFGDKYSLHIKKELSQLGQFVCDDRVIVVGSSKKLDFAVLGPFRDSTQVELSMTDARFLGLEAPIRDSGDLSNSSGGTIIGPKGRVELKNGVIIARRHLHINTLEAETFGLVEGQCISVRIPGSRALIFNEVIVRVDRSFVLSLHIDTDEANAAGIKGDCFGVLGEI